KALIEHWHLSRFREVSEYSRPSSLIAPARSQRHAISAKTCAIGLSRSVKIDHDRGRESFEPRKEFRDQQARVSCCTQVFGRRQVIKRRAINGDDVQANASASREPSQISKRPRLKPTVHEIELGGRIMGPCRMQHGGEMCRKALVGGGYNQHLAS